MASGGCISATSPRTIGFSLVYQERVYFLASFKTSTQNPIHKNNKALAIHQPITFKMVVAETPLKCAHGHTHYSEDELHLCSLQGRRLSLTAMDSASDDFWNLTLDDLDDLSDVSDHLSSHQERRRSDGMQPMVAARYKKMARRSVSFGKVEVRVCERVLGDNPCVGPSLSIGWNYSTETEFQVDDWEKKRVKERRPHEKLLLSPDKREKIAKRSGYTKEEIQKNVELMAKYQRRRDRTRKEFEKDCMATLLSESCNRSLAKFLQNRNKARSGSSSGSASRGNNARSNSQRSMRTI